MFGQQLEAPGDEVAVLNIRTSGCFSGSRRTSDLVIIGIQSRLAIVSGKFTIGATTIESYSADATGVVIGELLQDQDPMLILSLDLGPPSSVSAAPRPILSSFYWSRPTSARVLHCGELRNRFLCLLYTWTLSWLQVPSSLMKRIMW